MWCPKGCCDRNAVQYRNGLLTFVGPSGYGYEETKTAARVGTSPTLQRRYLGMISMTALRENPPTFEVHDDLHGVGGMFIADQWAIVVGAQDMRRIAHDVLGRWSHQVATIFVQTNGHWPTQEQLVHFVTEAATLRCIAHEIGHALIASGSGNPYHPDEEAGADYYAGRLDAAHGRSVELGKMFFYAIGCTGRTCSHPRPPTRAAAYAFGYDAQQRAA